eukprot:6051517-Alexandrium_andersonii.AAC.1
MAHLQPPAASVAPLFRASGPQQAARGPATLPALPSGGAPQCNLQALEAGLRPDCPWQAFGPGP